MVFFSYTRQYRVRYRESEEPPTLREWYLCMTHRGKNNNNKKKCSIYFFLALFKHIHISNNYITATTSRMTKAERCLIKKRGSSLDEESLRKVCRVEVRKYRTRDLKRLFAVIGLIRLHRDNKYTDVTDNLACPRPPPWE
jgi:hypothetical protein